MQVERSDVSPLAGREALHRITEAVLSRTEQGSVLRVLSARAYSVVCGPARSASLSRGKLKRRPRERHDHSFFRPTDPGRSSASGPLLAADAQASVYLGKPCRLPIAGRAQREASARGGRGVLSRGGRWAVSHAFPSSQAKGYANGAHPTGERRSPQHRGYSSPASTLERGGS
jgi:hypothetical protein